MTYDYGHAAFADSAAARSMVNAANPLTPGGISPRNTSIPTLIWALLFVAAAFFVYNTVFKRR